jgi:hypothetical protein
MRGILVSLAPFLLVAGCGGRVEEGRVPDATVEASGDAESSVPDAGLDATVDVIDDRWTPCGTRPEGLFECCGGAACKGMCAFENAAACTCFGVNGGCPTNTVCCLQFAACTTVETCKGGRR